MDASPGFRADLYRGTAADYHRQRVPYPAALVEDLVARAGLDGTGRLLDLACGPGRVTFALAPHAAATLAVDLEEEAIAYGRALAAERGAPGITWRVARVEDLDPAGRFALVTVGDAFHRLDRPVVAAAISRWLEPDGHVALLSTSMPWQGPAPWQRAAMDAVVHWMEVTGSIANIPAGLAGAMAAAPNPAVLAGAGLAMVGTYRYEAPRTWSVESLIGFAHSTSVLSRAALGAHGDAFERDLRDRLLAAQPDGVLAETVTFTTELARQEAAGT